MYKTILISSVLMLLAAPLMAAPAQNISDVHNVYLDYAAEPAIDKCEAALTQELVKANINLTQDAASADAVLKARFVQLPKHGLRYGVQWAARLQGAEGKEFYSDNGTEFGWSYAGACKDMVDDLAIPLGRDINTARLLGK